MISFSVFLAPFYQKIFSLVKGDILLFNESPFAHRIDGVLMDQKRITKRKVQSGFGESGGLLNAKCQPLKFGLNDENEFEFSLVSLGEKNP